MKQKFVATSYNAAGDRVKSITIEATNLAAAVSHPAVASLPRAGTSNQYSSRPTQIVGIRPLNQK